MKSSEATGNGSKGDGKDGSNGVVPGEMYKAVGQSVILYDREIWVVTGGMLKVLEGFHHWVARQITGLTERCEAGGEWEYPSVVEPMEAAGLQPIGVYIRRRQSTIAERVDFSPIYELCMEADRMRGTS